MILRVDSDSVVCYEVRILFIFEFGSSLPDLYSWFRLAAHEFYGIFNQDLNYFHQTWPIAIYA